MLMSGEVKNAKCMLKSLQQSITTISQMQESEKYKSAERFEW